MRHGLFAVAVVLLATAASAAPKKDKDEDETEEKAEKGDKKEKGKKGEKGEEGDDEKEGGGAGMMDQTAPDPAGTEGADKPEQTKAKKKVVVKASADTEAGADVEAQFAPPRKRLRVFGEVLIGFGGTPLPGPGEEIDGSMFTIRVGGSYDFSKKFTLGLLIPWTTGTVETPAEPGSGTDTLKRNTQAFGSPLITAEIRSSLGTHTTLPWGLAVGIPVAEGNPDFAGIDTANITKFLLNAMADANSGWRDGELFASKRLPVVPFIGIVHEKDRLEGHAFLKLPFLFNVGGEITQANLPGGTLEMNGVALRTVVGVGGKYWFLKSPMLFGGLELWTAHNTIRTVEFTSSSPDPAEAGGGDPNPLQWVLEPRVGARFGAVVPSVGYVLPLGGLLNEAGASGLRIGVDANF